MSGGNIQSHHGLASGKIVVTGARGQLGGQLCRLLGDRAIGWSRHEWDFIHQSATQARDLLLRTRPAVVINCAAYTKVDQAEQEQANCHAVNAVAVERLAEMCYEVDCTLVQISTDYVFGQDLNRTVPYVEVDQTGPQSFYAASKLAGEQAAMKWHKHFIVRTCGLYSKSPGGPVRGRNFVDTMLALAREGRSLRVVGDQWCTPSYVPDVACAILQLIATAEYGVYHVTNDGSTNWHDFARQLFQLAEMRPSVDRITTAEYPTAAARPRYSVLSCEKFATTCARLPTWQEGLRAYLAA